MRDVVSYKVDGYEVFETRRKVTIDFETFSECNLKKTSPWAYAEHPSTRVLCMAYQYENQDGPSLWIPDERMPFIKTRPLHIEAHNSEFEQAIWESIIVPQYGLSADVTWECTAAKAAAASLPRKLADVSRVLCLVHQIDKKKQSNLLKVSKPRKPSKNNPATTWLDDEERMQQLYEDCLNDVRVTVELSKYLRPLSEKEKEVWYADQRINRRGIYLDGAIVGEAINHWEKHKDTLNLELSNVTKGEITSGNQIGKLLQYVRQWDDSVLSVDSESIERLLGKRGIPPNIRRALELRKELSRNSVAKFSALSNRASSTDGRVRSLFMYHGAGTGRWAGKGFQPHNLPTGMALRKFSSEVCISIAKLGDLDLLKCFYNPPMDYLSACIRGALIPEKGKIFACADYSAIEARVLMWLVGHTEVLQKFRDGVDLYKDLATAIFTLLIEEIDSEQRNLGKRGILGLGFQMGAPKFQATCATYGQPIELDLAERVVKIYRETYWKVKQFWWDVERTALLCVRTGKPQQCGRVSFGIKGDFLHIALPSGRWLAYYKPRILPTETPWGEMKPAVWFDGPISPAGFGPQSTYGGKLTENIVQAIARDILAEAILRLENHGDYPVVVHVHDEALIEAEEEKLDRVVFEELMSRPPEWAPDLPIAIDAWYGHRYHK